MNKKSRALIFVSLIILNTYIPHVAAALSVSTNKSTYLAGETVTYTVSGASVNGLLLVQFLNPSSQPLYVSQGRATSAGSFMGQLKIPGNWQVGQYSILIKDDRTGTTAQTTFQISSAPLPPVIPTPPTPDQVQAMTDQEAATTIAGLTSTQAATTMAQLTTQKAANIINKLATATAANIVKEMTPSAAAAVMNQVQAKTAALVLVQAEKVVAMNIVKVMQTSSVAAVLKEAVAEGKTAFFSEIMNEVDEGQAADILLETDHEAGARIVEGMAQNNLNKAAIRVEAAVKKRLGETDPQKAREIVEKIARTLENADVQTLVDIFVEIVGLPATPSSVAVVLEVMDMNKVLDVVSAWVGAGSLKELAEVYSHFSVDFLETLWLAMSSAERNTLFPYLDATTVSRLPPTGKFQLTNLSVSPATVQPGAAVTISVKVTNIGTDTAAYTATLKIDEATEATTTVTLEPEKSSTVTWTVSRTAVKTYSVTVDSLSGSFTVEAPPMPAAFTLSSLQVSPASVEQGKTVTVTVQVKNTGEQSGSTTVELKINGVTEQTKSVTLDGGASTTVSFTVVKDKVGTYTVAVGSLTGSFTVTAPPTPPDNTWMYVLASLILVAVVGYYLYTRRRQSENLTS